MKISDMAIPMTMWNTSLHTERKNLKAKSDELLAQLEKIKKEYDWIQKQLSDYDDVLNWKKDASDVIKIQDGVEYLIVWNWWDLEKDAFYTTKREWGNYYFTKYPNWETFVTSGIIYPESDTDREHDNDKAFTNLIFDFWNKFYKWQKKIDDNVDSLKNWNWFIRQFVSAPKINRWRKQQTKPLDDDIENLIYSKPQYDKLINEQTERRMNRF